MKKVYIRTFGCQMNVRDSEFIKGIFLEKGYNLVDSPDKADVILFNTCSVRAKAEQRAISNMGLLLQVAGHKSQVAGAKQKQKIFGIVGCMAQLKKEELFKRLPGLDIVCGTGEIENLPELVERAKKEKILALKDRDTWLPRSNPAYRESKDHTYVTIMHGCNNFCSYCVVPHVRGHERSREVDDIVNEVKGLTKREIGDITLLGQNVNSYKGQGIGGKGQGRQRECDFIQLLEAINSIDGVKKIRFMTSHPKDASINLCKAMRDLDKVEKHLHLPVQSGSNRILKLMNRGYTIEKYMKFAKDARKIIPNIKLTTDFIVGFPTENEKDFKDTLSLMKTIRFNAAYIFKYSPRPGTKAELLKGDVPTGTKEKRHRILLDLQKHISKEKKHATDCITLGDSNSF